MANVYNIIVRDDIPELKKHITLLNVDLIIEDDQTSLLIAAIYKSLKCILYLLEIGADVNKRSSIHHISPLYLACHEYSDQGFEACLALINAGADINVKTEQEATPLYVTAMSNNEPMAKLLIDLGCQLPEHLLEHFDWVDQIIEK
jgi:ankyrin repeat protein